MGRRLIREGIYVHIQLIHVVQQKLTEHCKTIILRFLKNRDNEKYDTLTNESCFFMCHVKIITYTGKGGDEIVQVRYVRGIFRHECLKY